MVLDSFRELKFLQLCLPTHKTCEILTVYKEVENSLSFGQKDVLKTGSKGVFELGVTSVLYRRTDRPDHRPSTYHIQPLNVLFVAV